MVTSYSDKDRVIAETSTTSYLLSFFQSLSREPQSALLLDFDGTLAPFRVSPEKVRPWAGISELLEHIQTQTKTHIAIVSGRPAQEIPPLLGLRTAPEIHGLHGAERLFPDGLLERQALKPEQVDALEAARQSLQNAKITGRVENKWNAVAIHWRGHPPQLQKILHERTLDLWLPFADRAKMDMLQFDGGIELRAGPHKGDAVRFILAGLPASAPVAYLGDDVTDEDAFHALHGRGLTVLVRRNSRPTAAQLWLQPPLQLRQFLSSWLKASTGQAITSLNFLQTP